MSAAIGHKVRRESTGCIGTVVTYYDNGDLMVRIDGQYERWPITDTLGLGRR